jgi:hypothetical protein
MGAKAKVRTFLFCFSAVGVCARPVFADPLPTHGTVLHLDSGVVPIGISPFLNRTVGRQDNLDAPPNGYHWEIEIWNTGGFPEEFDMAIEVQTPKGPITVGSGKASVPGFQGLYWEYYLNPDPFGEVGATPHVLMTYTKPRIGLVPLAYQTTMTEDPLPANPPCPGRVPPPPFWVPIPPGNGSSTVSIAGAPDVVFTLMMADAKAIPGDYNADGTVNVLDYAVWAGNYGKPGVAADGNGNGIVDTADYAIWRDNVGAVSAVAANFSGGATSVPEPPVTCLAMLAFCLAAPAYRIRWSLAPKFIGFGQAALRIRKNAHEPAKACVVRPKFK